MTLIERVAYILDHPEDAVPKGDYRKALKALYDYVQEAEVRAYEAGAISTMEDA